MWPKSGGAAGDARPVSVTVSDQTDLHELAQAKVNQQLEASNDAGVFLLNPHTALAILLF